MATMFQRLQEMAGADRRSTDTKARRTNPSTGNLVRLGDGSLVSFSKAQEMGYLKGMSAPPKMEPGTVMNEKGVIIKDGGSRADKAKEDSQLAQRQVQQELDEKERRRPKGRQSTIITGGTGIVDGPKTARRSLMGF